MKNSEENRRDTRSIIADLKENLNPEMRSCYVDAFLTHKLRLEVSRPHSSGITPGLFVQNNHSLMIIHIFYMLY